MNMRLPELDGNASVWIELLVDNELTDSQSQQLFAHMDLEPHRWREAAIAFLDHRFLQKQLCSSPSKAIASINRLVQDCDAAPMPEAEDCAVRLTKRRSPQRSWLIYVAAAMLACFCFLAGRSSTNESLIANHSLPPSQWIEGVYEMANTLEKVTLASLIESEEQSSMETLSTYDRPQMLIAEVSPDRVVYYADHELPDLVLQAFVDSGCNISCRPYEPSLKDFSTVPEGKPFYVVEVSHASPLDALSQSF